MPWKETTQMSSRLEFVLLALKPGANIRLLCRSFNVSPMTGYKLLARYQEQGEAGLLDQSRRPHSSPLRSSDELESQVLALHALYPCWGSRKLRVLLPAGVEPHPSTIDAILRRHGKHVETSAIRAQEARSRFEHPAPNLLWQMDFKGHFALTDSQAGRCHPLTVLDDHSRFSLCLAACSNERRQTVQEALTRTFRVYGLPERMTYDNGPPWGSTVKSCLSGLDVWLVRLGIRVSHSRPYHPQTQGKDERFHRTLKLELIERSGFNSIATCQSAFDEWRERYNLIRPHEALGLKPPISRYQSSARQFPEQLPKIEYDPSAEVRKVRGNGNISYKAREYFVGEGLIGEIVQVQQGPTDGVYRVLFCDRKVGIINLRKTT
jgi:transposase InsO family protein